MGNYTYRFNPISGEFDIVQDLSLIHVKDPVDTYNDLPITGNTENDARFVKDTDILYVWTIASASGSLSDWKETAKMSIADLDALDDGSVYGRVKNTELEEGQVKRLDDGTNEVSALDAKDTVDKKHIQGTDRQLKDEIDSYTKLLLHCNGVDGSQVFIDDSPSAHTVTATNQTQIDTAQKKFGTGSVLFDGATDNLSMLNSPDWVSGSENFTIDFWVRLKTVKAINTFFEQADGWKDNVGIRFYGGGTSDWRIEYGISSTNITERTLGIHTLLPNVWYHIAVVRNGTSLKLYIDGTNVGTNTIGSIYNSTSSLQIGQDYHAGHDLDGWMDEIRLSKGIARWTSNFTLLTKEYGYSIDISDISDAVDKKHDKLHEINNTLNHLGISGSGIEDNFMAIDVNGLPKNSGKSAIDFANASHNHVESDITDLDHYTSEDFSDDFGLADLANLATKSYNDLTDKPDLSDLHFHDNKVELDLITDGDHDVRVDNPHIVSVDQLDLASGTVASDIDDAISKKHTQNTDTGTSNNFDVVGEISIKLYSQNDEPTLGQDNRIAIWIDTDDSNRVYLLYRRGVGDQVAVELA